MREIQFTFDFDTTTINRKKVNGGEKSKYFVL
jgi:hypothetical protein